MTDGRGRSRPTRPAWILTGLVTLVLFLELAAFGASDRRTAAAFSVVFALLCIGAHLAPGRPSRSLADISAPGVLFLVVLGWGILSLFTTFGAPPHAAWEWAGAKPVGTLDKQATILEVVNLAGLACVFLTGRVLARSDRAVARCFSALLLAGGLYAGWAILEFVMAKSEFYGLGRRMFPNRLTGSFLSPNTAATFFGVLSILASGLLLRTWLSLEDRGGLRALFQTRSVRRFGLAAVSLALVTTALVMTRSRAGIGATALAQAVLWLGALNLVTRGGLRKALVPAALLILLVGLVTAVNVSDLRNTDPAGDLSDRIAVAGAHYDAFLRQPVAGYGLGAFDTINKMLMSPTNFAAMWQNRAAHNVYVQWLEEAGIVGAAAMFLAIGALLLTLARMASRSVSRVLALAILAASFLVLLHGALDFALQVHGFAAVWALLLGLGAGLAAASDRVASSEDTSMTAASRPAGSEVLAGVALSR